jgi:hypothetical protein
MTVFKTLLTKAPWVTAHKKQPMILRSPEKLKINTASSHIKDTLKP